MASDTAKISQDNEHNEHHTLHGALNLLKNIKIPHLGGLGVDKPKAGECGVLQVPGGTEQQNGRQCALLDGSTRTQPVFVCSWECC